MRKIFLMTFALLVIFSCTAFAAQTGKTLGVVIVGGSEFKTKDYYKMVTDVLKLQKHSPYKIGDEMQSKYQRFLLENDLVGENIPRKQNLMDFAGRSGCDEVIFLFMNSAEDHQNSSNSRQRNRISVQVDAYLCDGFRVIDVATTSQNSDSSTSDLRARRSAFKKCLTEIAKAMKFAG